MEDKSNYYNERSAGGVVYKIKDGQIWWLLIKVIKRPKKGPIRAKRGQNNQRFIYKLPKGHLNPGEYLKAAALREVAEEAKVEAKIIKKIGSNDYVFKDAITKEKLIKKVTFFLMEYKGQVTNVYSDAEKIIGRAWLRTEVAIKKLAYESEKILIKKADVFLKHERKNTKTN